MKNDIVEEFMDKMGIDRMEDPEDLKDEIFETEEVFDWDGNIIERNEQKGE